MSGPTNEPGEIIGEASWAAGTSLAFQLVDEVDHGVEAAARTAATSSRRRFRCHVYPANDLAAWQSSPKATRRTSPFQQMNSRPSEHQRVLERSVATWPLCSRGRRGGMPTQ